jgi:hypothetical protein
MSAAVSSARGLTVIIAIVVGVDAIEIVLHHLHAGGLLGIKCPMDGADRGFVEQDRKERGLDH